MIMLDTKPLNGFVRFNQNQMLFDVVPTEKRIVKFPYAPSAFWESDPTIEWDATPRSKFARGAVALDLKRKRNADGSLRVWTKLEDLYMLILWSWGHD